MERYEALSSGAVDRVIGQFEKQSEHRRAMESKDMDADSRLSFIGLFLAFGVVVSFVIAGSILILNGHSIEGVSSALTGLGVIVASFIYATKNRKAEREQKYRILSGDQQS
jgi:uncharacterized membrane protein